MKKRAWLVLAFFGILGVLLILAGVRPHSRVLFNKGVSAYGEDDYAGALSHWQEALIDHPNHPLLYYNIGNAYYQQEDYARAYEAYIQVSEASNVEQWRQYNLGNTSYRATQQTGQNMIEGFALALEYYRAAIVADPTDLDAKTNYEFVRQQLEQAQQESQGESEPSDETKPPDEEEQESPQDPSGEAPDQTPQAEVDFGGLTPEEALRLLDYLNVQEGELQIDPQDLTPGTDTAYYW